MTYDADGNMLTKDKPGVWSQTFTWNSLGQLTQVVTNGTTTTFGYDGFGRRVRKTTGGTTTRYLHDGDDLIAELDGGGSLIREYAHYPGVDRPHSVRQASDGLVFYYTTELPGHVTGLVNSSNEVVNRYEYTPWGEAITTIEEVAQPLRYGARELDAETGLYYYRARYYDPKMGRFIAEDPIGLAGGLNVFRYVADDPMNRRDPFGLGEDDPCPTGYELVKITVIDFGNGSGSTIYKCQSASGATYAFGVPWNEPVTVTAPMSSGPGARGADYLLRGALLFLPGGLAILDRIPDRNGVTPEQCRGDAINTGVTALAGVYTVSAYAAGTFVEKVGVQVFFEGVLSPALTRSVFVGGMETMSSLSTGGALIENGAFLTTAGTALQATAVGVGGLAAGYVTGAGLACAVNPSYYR